MGGYQRNLTTSMDALVHPNRREEHARTVYFTADRTPVEQLIDQIILDAVVNQGK